MAARCWDLLVRHLEDSQHAQIAVASPLLSLLVLRPAVFLSLLSVLQGLKAAPWCPLSTRWRRCTTRSHWSRWTSSSTTCVRAAVRPTPKLWKVGRLMNRRHMLICMPEKYWAAIKATRTFLPSHNVILHYHQEHHRYLDDLLVILQNRSFWFCTVLIPVFKKVRDALSPKISSIYVDSFSISKSHLMALSNWAGVDHTPD